MADWLVTANLGGSFASPAVKASGLAWADDTIAKRPAIVFVQEVPSQLWLGRWMHAGYRITVGDAREWKTRSALLTRQDLSVTQVTRREFPTLAYHGSYIAAARLASKRGDIVVASVHASPNKAEPGAYGWPGDLPTPRKGGNDTRYPGGELWDSDLLLETLRLMAGHGPLVAGGDYNEARGHDLDDYGTRFGTWGNEYFDRATELQLVAWPAVAWGEERPTRGGLQLDHVLVSSAAEGFLVRDPEPRLDDGWPTTGMADRSDHTPVWIALGSDWL
jgi:hypothetical protein